MTTHPHACLRRSVALVLTAGLALPGPARAATRAAPVVADAEPGGEASEANALGAEGVAAFRAGDHDRAIELFERSYALDPKPNLIFNIGRVYEDKGELERALEQYSKFVVEAGVDLETRQLAAERIRAIREILDGLADDPRDRPESDTPSSAPAQDTSRSAPPSDAASPEQRKVRTLRIAGFSLLGGGAALLVVGGVLGGVASQRVALADGEPIIEHADQRRREAQKFARVADAMFIAGGAVALAGVVLVVVGYTGARRRDVAVAPRVGRTHAGLVLEGRF